MIGYIYNFLSNQKYNAFPLLSHFSLAEVFVPSYAVSCIYIYIYIYIEWDGWDFVSFLLCSLVICANNPVHNDPMVVFLCLHITLPHYHYHIDLGEGIELLKSLLGTFCLECVSKIKSIPSIIFHAVSGVVRIQLPDFACDDCENICTLLKGLIMDRCVLLTSTPEWPFPFVPTNILLIKTN